MNEYSILVHNEWLLLLLAHPVICFKSGNHLYC